ncbi:Soluble aldose sugar dehydrogenase YliI precursor [Rubripirellula amarantea]|uniref:Soluble aldose sugar dehydrogenase YliI n=1 Tax=Rubripirellula amarantea TaxID=2527999 RepID=A0A5C5WGY2_9BACT|nr:family 16 glycoside hydrolase [Rubripirellula amarantea]TWT49369.1 Soluble aldose sugar dehydrogenase YliI precursor [Rubripirellula amarantea]
MKFTRWMVSLAFGFGAIGSTLLSPPSHGEEIAGAAATLTDSEKRSGWELLFDGKSTEGWRNYGRDKVSEGWQIVDGALVRNAKGAGDLITDEKYKYFELSLEYKISKGGNSGVMFHVAEGDGPPWHTGPEVQVQDNKDGHDPQLAGWLYQLYKPVPPSWTQETGMVDSTRPAGEWNQLYLRISPGQSEVCMNGVVYYRFNLGGDDWKQRVAKSKFANLPNFGSMGEGHICLQDHGDEVAYRKIKLRRIADDGSVKQPIDGQLDMVKTLAFPKLKWDQWEPFDDGGKTRALRLLELTYPEDGSNRLFVSSQHGGIWSFENKPDVETSTLFLDLRGKVIDWQSPGANEQGLLGLAFHPDYKNNGRFFVYYSHLDDKKSVISEFKVSANDPNVADPDSEKVILEIPQPFKNHNGGSIEFGPDGMLYVGLGDGGSRNDPFGNGQNLKTMLGSILRIDVDHPADGKAYGIPKDNPFVGRDDALGEIFAYGVRNPWRIAFDKETGTLWAGEVGQELWEEVIVVRKGGNYGWSVREGSHPFGNGETVAGTSDPLEPIWEYDHQIGKSITGGRVYRSDRESKLAGKYIYADYVTGTVWALTYDAAAERATSNEQVIAESVPVLSFGQDQNGEVYLLTNSPRGESIYRFESVSPKSDAALSGAAQSN